MATVVLAGVAAGQQQEEQGLIFGPDDPQFNDLPAWVASPGSDACSLTIPEGEDHGPYYELGARHRDGTLEVRYGAGVEGLPNGGEENPGVPAVVNEIGLRVRGMEPGTYTVEEPHGLLTEVTVDAEGEGSVEIVGEDPQQGPVTDLTITEGNVRIMDGLTEIVSISTAHTCVPYEGDPNNELPRPAFTATCNGLECTFDASASTDPDGQIVAYGWDFGDGSPTGSGQIVTHTYAAGGTYTVTLRVTDNSGAVRGSSQQVTLNEPPTASFTATCNGHECTFDASASADADGTIASYAWDFGDGATGTGATATHTYAAGGPVDVTLTVTDDQGATHATMQTVDVPRITATFTPHDGNEWWVQTRVSSNVGAPTAVCASINGGTCEPLTLRSWGSWAAGYNAPTGSHVVFTATFGAQGSVDSPTFAWPSGNIVDDGAPTQPPSPPPGDGGTVDATFTPHDGNEWWVQTRVQSSAGTPTAVCASVNGGTCEPLTLRSWGSWANSFFVASGSHVTFTATFSGGATATSPTFVWPSGQVADGGTTPPPGDGGDAAFDATFTPHDGNEWWVQTRVDANEQVTSVCASVNGGECRALTLRSWGSWAESFSVPNGAQVTFTATSASGATDTSQAYTWPVR